VIVHRSSRRIVAIAAGCAALAAFAADAAEIYKCVDRSGVDRYQNFPCAVDSPGWMPSTPATPKPSTPIASPSKPTPSPPPATPPKDASTPRPGMTADEVKALWGEPDEILQDEPRSGRVEIWQYADGRVVQINVKQRVISIQR
jgi:hypothetical protein